MVRITEFESARVSPLTPEISASTSSAISALLIYITTAYDVCKEFFSLSKNKKNLWFMPEILLRKPVFFLSCIQSDPPIPWQIQGLPQ